MLTITRELFLKTSPDESELNEFDHLCPDGLEVTENNCRDMTYFIKPAGILLALSKDLWEEHATSTKEVRNTYDKARREIEDTYNKASTKIFYGIITKRFIRQEDLDKFIREHTGVYKS